MTQQYKISILGDGGWGTALALLSERRGNKAMLWSAFPDYAQVMNEKRENEKFLRGIKIPGSIRITSNLSEAVEFGEILVLAIPAQYLRNILFKLKDFDLKSKILVSVSKGIETKTLLRPSEVIYSILGHVNLAVLSGPSHAEEVARNIPTLVVVASHEARLAEEVQKIFHDPMFRIYTQTDVLGVELAGALKNIIAIGAGLCDGLGYGANTKAGLLTRGLLEITRLGIRLGANPNTFFGLSGVGDLVTTCISEYGRNLRVGRLLGEGKKLSEVLSHMEMVAEGVETTRSAYQLVQKFNVNAPIITEMYHVLFENKPPKQAISELMTRQLREEMKQY